MKEIALAVLLASPIVGLCVVSIWATVKDGRAYRRGVALQTARTGILETAPERDRISS